MGDPSPFVLPECEALAAQQRWQDGYVPAIAPYKPRILPANKHTQNKSIAVLKNLMQNATYMHPIQ
jgi:hypothetical protein